MEVTAVDTSSEAWRHECEARHIAGLQTREERREYLAFVAKKRGDAAAKALRQRVTEIWEERRGANR